MGDSISFCRGSYEIAVISSLHIQVKLESAIAEAIGNALGYMPSLSTVNRGSMGCVWGRVAKVDCHPVLLRCTDEVITCKVRARRIATTTSMHGRGNVKRLPILEFML